ncbi:MAG: hypothetical protein ATN35_05915 [Epulopiscium sp. Nele67-Bin004]|nr:MAG: hypothetical protein ATN35_05915 [Epulopiscium sp. Nele67-Bin004]
MVEFISTLTAHRWKHKNQCLWQKNLFHSSHLRMEYLMQWQRVRERDLDTEKKKERQRDRERDIWIEKLQFIKVGVRTFIASYYDSPSRLKHVILFSFFN